jgi:hypothetical protein
MLRYFFILLSLLFLPLLSPAQDWLPAGSLPQALNPQMLFPDTLNDRLLIGGTFNDTPTGIARVFSYQNGQLSLLESYAGGTQIVSGFFYFQDELLVYGGFDSIGGVWSPAIVQLEGNDFLPLDWGDLSEVIMISELLEWQGDLLAVGQFASIDGLNSPCIARWDGTDWKAVGTGLPGYNGNGFLIEAVEYKGRLYAGGNFSHQGEQWDLMVLENGQWTKPPGWSISDPFSNITAMEVFDGYLYVAGQFTKAGGSLGNNILRFDGEQWEELGDGTSFKIWDLHATTDYLLVAGNFQAVDALSTSHLAIWTGNSWCKAHHAFFPNGSIQSMAFYQDTLFVLGGFDFIDNEAVPGFAKRNETGPPLPFDCIPIISSVPKVVDLNPNLFIWPNPATELLFIELPAGLQFPAQLEIIHPNGRIEKTQLNNNAGLTVEWAIDQLPQGAYWIRVADKQKQWISSWIRK